MHEGITCVVVVSHLSISLNTDEYAPYADRNSKEFY
jgi:hypothetical protein